MIIMDISSHIVVRGGKPIMLSVKGHNEELWTRFYRADEPRTSDENLGLGLPIVK